MSKHKPKKKKNQPVLNPHLKTVTDEEISLLKRDDLLEINHINPTIEIALNTIGLNTYDDFLDKTPEEIARSLRQRAGMTITARTISTEDWIGQAKILSQNDRMATEELEPKNTVTECPSESTIVKVEHDAGKSPMNILPVDRTGEQAVTGTTISLRIVEASFVPGESIDETIAKKLLSTIRCSVSGTYVDSLTENSQSLCVQIHALDDEAHHAELLFSKSVRVNDHQTDYTMDFEVELLKTGHYRLQVIAFIIAPKPEIAFHQGPWLRVIE